MSRLKTTHRRPVTDYGSSVSRWMLDRKFKWRHPCPAASSLPEEGSHLQEWIPPIAMDENTVTQIPLRHIHASLNKIKHPINTVKWTPEGRRLLTGSSSGEFTLWNGTGFNFETIMQAHDSAIRALEYSHGAEWLLSGDQDGVVKYWQTNFNNVKILQAHDSPIRDISFCPSDTRFVTASDDGSLKIWSFGDGLEERVLSGHGWDVKSADWHPWKGVIVSGSKDHLVKLWDPRMGRCVATLHGHKNTVSRVRFQPSQGNLLATSSRDHTIRIFDLRAAKDLCILRDHEKEVSAITWHPLLPSLLSTGALDGSIRHFVLNESSTVVGGSINNYNIVNSTISIPHAHENAIWSMEYHPLGHILCSGSNDRSTRFWSRPRVGDTESFQDRYYLGDNAADNRYQHKRKHAAPVEEEDMEDEIDFLPEQQPSTMHNITYDAFRGYQTSPISDNQGLHSMPNLPGLGAFVSADSSGFSTAM